MFFGCQLLIDGTRMNPGEIGFALHGAGTDFTDIFLYFTALKLKTMLLRSAEICESLCPIKC